MENKEIRYYTPEIRDLHIEYKYEYLNNGDDWISHIINNKADLLECIEDLEINQLRTKFLDKPDIESLGWNQGLSGYFKENNRLTLLEGNRILISQSQMVSFCGKCPSINELKKIMELLEIK